MKQAESKTDVIFLLAFAGTLFLVLVLRNIGLYPTVFADEYTYSALSRLLPYDQSTIPSYIYLILFKATNLCGDEFLSCARIINSFFFVATIPFIFLICRGVVGKGLSAFLSLLALLGPINTYTAYFMPESLYFFMFWLFSWTLLKIDFEKNLSAWLVAGIVYGASTLVKPHALFIFPAVTLYIVFSHYFEKMFFFKRILLSLFLFTSGAIICKFLVSYAIAGASGLTWFGPAYKSVASSSVPSDDNYSQIVEFTILNLKGHVLAGILIYGLPLLISFSVVMASWSRTVHQEKTKERSNRNLDKIAFLVVAMLLSLVLVTAAFTASVAGLGPYETPYRLHMRYYNFLLPFLYIVAAGTLSSDYRKRKTFYHYIFGISLVLVSVYALNGGLALYATNHVDGPEIRGLLYNKDAFYFLGASLIVTFSFWVLDQQYGVRVYLYGMLPALVLVSSFYSTFELRNQMHQNSYDRAGIFARLYLTTEERRKMLVVGSEHAGLFRSLFHIDNSEAAMTLLSRGDKIDLSLVAADREWILVIGDHEVLTPVDFEILMDGFRLVRVGETSVIDFTRSWRTGLLRKSIGLSVPESWGTWSLDDEVVLEFATPLPRQFVLRLSAHAFGPNTQGIFEVSVGPSTHAFVLSEQTEERLFTFQNIEQAKIIKIKVPYPVSLRSLGIGDDTRRLGIGLVRMEIVLGGT
jgi:phosphoglycerol transferase